MVKASTCHVDDLQVQVLSFSLKLFFIIFTLKLNLNVVKISQQTLHNKLIIKNIYFHIKLIK